MIKHKLSAMPPCNTRENRSKDRQGQPVRQNLIRSNQTNTPVGAGNRQQRHGGHGMGPASNAGTDAAHQQKLGGSHYCRSNAENKCKPGAPDACAQKERVARKPVEQIKAERADNQRNGEMNAHGVNRMAGNGDCRRDVVLGDFLNDRTGIVFGFAHFASRGCASVAAATLKRWRLFLTPFVLLALTACAGPLSTLEPAGPSASLIATLWWVMLAGSTVLFLLVMVLLTMAYLRPGFGSNVPAMKWVLYGGLVMPVVVLTALVGYALVVGERILAHPGTAETRVGAHGQMWHWTFTYPDYPGIGETDVLHIPVGQPIDVIVTAGDVIHSFWVPRLAGKIDAIPGHENVVRIEADRAGVYNGVCAEFCGAGHTEMRFAVVAHEPEEYAAALLEAAQ